MPVRHAGPQPIESKNPATFESRGIAPPFTTPLLAGARVRPSRSGLELLVPNPSGGQGVYIVTWPGVRAFCNPTVHDTLLARRLSNMPRVDPSTVRGAAQDVARAGYAGREAMAAAEANRDSDESSRALAHFLLLADLLAQSDPTLTAATAPEPTADFYRRAGPQLRRIAPSFGCPAAHLNNGLTALADAFAPIGIAPDDQAARIPRLIARLGEAETQLSHWLDADVEHDFGRVGRTVTRAMQVTHNAATAVLAASRSALADPVTLLKRWIAHPDDTMAQPLRCDWLLDGWEPIALLWQTATTVRSRRAALLEMAQLLPPLPDQVLDWTNGLVLPDDIGDDCRVISQNDTWRRGAAALALIQRNESLRAQSS